MAKLVSVHYTKAPVSCESYGQEIHSVYEVQSSSSVLHVGSECAKSLLGNIAQIIARYERQAAKEWKEHKSENEERGALTKNVNLAKHGKNGPHSMLSIIGTRIHGYLSNENRLLLHLRKNMAFLVLSGLTRPRTRYKSKERGARAILAPLLISWQDYCSLAHYTTRMIIILTHVFLTFSAQVMQ